MAYQPKSYKKLLASSVSTAVVASAVVGTVAPAFTTTDDEGNTVSLSDFKGKVVVLYFYPKDDTPGGTKQAQSFREHYAEYQDKDLVVLGVSMDDQASHQKFKEKYDLPFELLSDEEKKVVEKYGVWKEKNMYGRKYMGIERTTFIIDEKGNIQKIFPRVKVNGHVEKVIEELNN